MNLTQFNCLDNKKKNFDADTCRQAECPLEYDTIKHELTLSSLVDPGLKEYTTLSEATVLDLTQKLGTNLTFELFKSLWVTVKVFYPSVAYTQLAENKKTNIIDLFAQIG